MKLTIDNLAGAGRWITPPRSRADRAAPDRAHAQRTLALQRPLVLWALDLAHTPCRSAAPASSSASDAGATLFTGYLATEPVAEYAGTGLAGPVYRTAFARRQRRVAAGQADR